MLSLMATGMPARTEGGEGVACGAALVDGFGGGECGVACGGNICANLAVDGFGAGEGSFCEFDGAYFFGCEQRGELGGGFVHQFH